MLSTRDSTSSPISPNSHSPSPGTRRDLTRPGRVKSCNCPPAPHPPAARHRRFLVPYLLYLIPMPGRSKYRIAAACTQKLYSCRFPRAVVGCGPPLLLSTYRAPGPGSLARPGPQRPEPAHAGDRVAREAPACASASSSSPPWLLPLVRDDGGDVHVERDGDVRRAGEADDGEGDNAPPALCLPPRTLPSLRAVAADMSGECDACSVPSGGAGSSTSKGAPAGSVL